MPTVLGRNAATGQVKLRTSDGSIAFAKWHGNAEPAVGSSVEFDSKLGTATSKVAVYGGQLPQPLRRNLRSSFNIGKDKNDVDYANGDIWDIDIINKTKKVGKLGSLFYTYDSAQGQNIKLYIGSATEVPVLIDTRPAAFVVQASSSLHMLADGKYIAGVMLTNNATSTIELVTYSGDLTDESVVATSELYTLDYLPYVKYFGYANWQIVARGQSFPYIRHFDLTRPADTVNGGTLGKDACGLGTSGTSASAGLVLSKPPGFVLTSLSGSGSDVSTSEIKSASGAVCNNDTLTTADIGKLCSETTGTSTFSLAGTFIAKSTKVPTAATGSFSVSHQCDDYSKETLVAGGAGLVCSIVDQNTDFYTISGATATISWQNDISADWQIATTDEYSRPAVANVVTDIATSTYTGRVDKAIGAATSGLAYTASGTVTYDSAFFNLFLMPGVVSSSTPPSLTKSLLFKAAGQAASVLSVSETRAEELMSKDTNLLGDKHLLVSSFDVYAGSAAVQETSLLVDPAASTAVNPELFAVNGEGFPFGLIEISASYAGETA